MTQRTQAASPRNSLIEMMHVLGSADAFERGRSDEHDLQELRAIALAIGQESELLQNERIEMLRFVDDENGCRIERDERREKTMQRRNQVVTAEAFRPHALTQHAEILQHLKDQLLDADARIDDDADGMMTGEPGHQRAAQERLSSPGFAHHQHEAFTLPNCRGDLLERPDVRVAAINEPLIGTQPERLHGRRRRSAWKRYERRFCSRRALESVNIEAAPGPAPRMCETPRP